MAATAESFQVGSARVLILQGDITTQDTDAIVNAANSSLMGGGGVDGAIHRAGGSAILAECKKIVAEIGSCETGEAVITTGGKLPAKHVIHTVGPVYRGGERGEPELLADAYKNSFRLAVDNGLKSVSFPSISTGAYRYPIDDACEIALGAIRSLLEEEGGLEEVRFVLFSDSDLEVYLRTARNVFE